MDKTKRQAVRRENDLNVDSEHQNYTKASTVERKSSVFLNMKSNNMDVKSIIEIE